MELYHKQNVCCIVNLAHYDNLSVKQACFDPISKEVQIHRACPDVEDGYRFMRLSKFVFDFKDLDAVINNMPLLKDNDELIVELSIKPNKRLVFALNEQFGNWELGFQKKTIQKRKAVVVDLSEDDIEQGVSTQKNLRVEVMKPDYECNMGKYDSIKLKKNEDFEYMIDHLLEFRKEVLDEYPILRNQCNSSVSFEGNEFNEHFFKRNIDLFKYMTYQMGYDQESRSVSRIALLRQYANDLKAISDSFDLSNFVKNEKKAFEYCRVLRATRTVAREQQQQQQGGGTSTFTRSQQQPPSKKKNI